MKNLDRRSLAATAHPPCSAVDPAATFDSLDEHCPISTTEPRIPESSMKNQTKFFNDLCN
ncbi:hypothetical protein Sjap_009843 [Stephania japonica]|uniref:Uncharacterized protein n=1 Tax=Stephania japonica TaxID=461633 RepID=A0AAP0P6L0_9MAGN